MLRAKEWGKDVWKEEEVYTSGVEREKVI